MLTRSNCGIIAPVPVTEHWPNQAPTRIALLPTLRPVYRCCPPLPNPMPTNPLSSERALQERGPAPRNASRGGRVPASLDRTAAHGRGGRPPP
eukprot:13349579-Alexandrium_andersonii.AAC.1